jgi:hypothetical protein
VLGDIDIPIVMMDNPEPSSTTYKQKRIPEAYQALADMDSSSLLMKKGEAAGDSTCVDSDV